MKYKEEKKYELAISDINNVKHLKIIRPELYMLIIYIHILDGNYDIAVSFLKNHEEEIKSKYGAQLYYNFFCELYAHGSDEENFFVYLDLAIQHGEEISAFDDDVFLKFKNTERFLNIINNIKQ